LNDDFKSHAPRRHNNRAKANAVTESQYLVSAAALATEYLAMQWTEETLIIRFSEFTGPAELGFAVPEEERTALKSGTVGCANPG
jgi:hypothetical protein